jgi:hypothetical protein
MAGGWVVGTGRGAAAAGGSGGTCAADTGAAASRQVFQGSSRRSSGMEGLEGRGKQQVWVTLVGRWGQYTRAPLRVSILQ